MLDDAIGLQAIVRRAVIAAGLGMSEWLTHAFEPQGVSLLAFGPQGRLALHTWPELGVVTIDLWTETKSGDLALELCKTALGGSARPTGFEDAVRVDALVPRFI